MFEDLGDQFYSALIQDNRWELYIQGLGIALLITVIALVIGLVLGTLVAIAKVNYAEDKRFRIPAGIGEVYTTVIRGTPVVVQLLIMYYIIFQSAAVEHGVYVAALTFGINSGAYMSEIVRAGIQSIDRGQMEAGRSLGFSRGMTMRTIIFPQAIKNILPALGNEMITLFKETSIVGYVAVVDLTRAAELVRSRTWQPYVPLLFAAGLYLIIVLLLAWGLRKLEAKLAKGDQR